MLRAFWSDDNGFLISAELILIATMLVIGLIVGLIELQASIIHELRDVACAIGSINQSYSYPGASTNKGHHTVKVAGSSFTDVVDDCDCGQCTSFFCSPITGEAPHRSGHGGHGKHSH